MPTFSELGLIPELLRAVEDQGYAEPTPIQARAIPLVLQGKDVMGGAQTGTGKTAGFMLPLLQRLAHYANTSASPARHPVRALILAPTRELAAQIEESVRTYGKYLGLRCTVVFGGISIDPQIAALRRGVEILVATPGRLLDHVQQRSVNLSQVEIFVLDEADRMLDMGFIPDVKRIIALLPKTRQNLLFSATISDEIRSLSEVFLHDPVLLQVARRNAAADLVEHLVHPVARERKRELLAHLLKTRRLNQVLVFTATRLGANRLAYQLNHGGIHATAIHGDKSQPERLHALDEFKSGKVGVLVATDVAARGLDIEDLPHVVNFDLPASPEDYVHRIGRTGRAGSRGEAISLVCADERERLAAIEQMIKLTIRKELVPGFEPDASLVPSFMGAGRRAGRGGGRGADVLSGGAREPRRQRPAPERAERDAPAADTFFSRPYEPAPPSERSAQRETPVAPRRQIAALLGGMPAKRR
ncbi:MAG: DEAD/DEAH box helicase [Betaproteobacteria bacterium]|nr:DEAD/DEAH box helicase [Betaproteobacteria bacterium]